MKKIFFFLVSVLAATSISAQNMDTPNYELAARFSQPNVRRMLFSTKVNPMWFQNSDKFLYEWKTSEGSNLYLVDPVKGTRKAVFDMARLAMQLTAIVKDPMDAQHIPMKNIQLEDDRYVTFSITSTQKRKFDNDTTELAKRKKGSKQVFYFRYDLEEEKLLTVSGKA